MLDSQDSQFTSQSVATIKQSYYFDLIAVPPSIRKSQHPSNKLFQNRIQSSAKFTSKESPNQPIPKCQSQHSTNSDFKTTSLQNLLLQKDQQFDKLQKKYIQVKSTQSKNSNKQGQNYLTGYADHAIHQIKALSQWPNLFEEQQKYLQDFLQNMIQFINSLNDIFRFIQNNSDVCSQRLTQADYIIQQLEKSQHTEVRENDLFNLRRVITQLYDSLITVTNSESQMNKLYRDYKKLCIDHSQLQVQFDKINQLREVQDKSISTIKKQFRTQNEETQQTKKFLRREQHNNQEQQKRVVTLEQRLDILQGNETYKRDKDALRNIIDDMIKESELNKRKAFSKTQEVQKLEQQLSEYKEKCTKLNRRCYLLERQLKTFGYTSYDINQKFIPKIPLATESSLDESDEEQYTVYQQLEEIFQKGQVPRKLDFKFEKLSKVNKEYILDLTQNGCSTMSELLMNMKDGSQKKGRNNQIHLIISKIQSHCFQINLFSLNCYLKKWPLLLDYQMIPYKWNHMSKYCLISPQLSRNQFSLNSNATFYTLDKNQNRKNAFIDADAFFEVIKNQRPYFRKNSQKFIIYRCADTNQSVYVSNCLIIPILHQQSILGIIVAGNLVDMDYLIENSYYLMILAGFTMKGILQQFSSVKVIKYQLKYKNLLFECFEELTQQKSLFDFSQKVLQYGSRLFGVEQIRFYFYEQHNLVKYNSELLQDYFPSNLGLAGYASRQQKNVIVSNIQKHDAYHQRIDIDTIMPVFVIPILSESVKKLELDSPMKIVKKESKEQTCETIGVLEVGLNQRVKVQQNDKMMELSHLMSSNDTLQSMATMFSQVITMGYKYMSHMINLKK